MDMTQFQFASNIAEVETDRIKQILANHQIDYKVDCGATDVKGNLVEGYNVLYLPKHIDTRATFTLINSLI